MHPEFLFSSEPEVRRIAAELYQGATALPLVCPHGHVDPRLFSEPAATFGSPADLLIIPDHYVTRMLYSQGIPLESLGVPRVDDGPVETDHRQIWRTFCENFYLFRGTPSGSWLMLELSQVFGIDEKPSAANADRLYDHITEKLATAEFSPRALFDRFHIEVLCTTDAATSTLEHHQAVRRSGWPGRVIPTFRPDAVVRLDEPGWNANIEHLAEVSRVDVKDYASFIRALEQRREFFVSMGAVATDHAVLTPDTASLEPDEAETIFQRALLGDITGPEAARFGAHMLSEMARMSIEDGLVMQLHPGSLRNYNETLFQHFGTDIGADIPIQHEFTRGLLPLLHTYGNDRRLSLVLFTLDESTYSRELAPLAGLYPTLKLGPPWWFFDSPNGMRRYFDQVMETAGLYNTAGFIDDTRAFCSIPARHEVWRRVSADWLAGLAARHQIDLEDARQMMSELAAGLARRVYKLEKDQ